MSFRPFQPFRGFGGGASLSFDADAADYFTRIVTAGSTISAANKIAVNTFVVGCKADGIWASIKASCLLCAADDLTGALVPLVGPSPTNVGPFASGDYSRISGLTGGTGKALNTNRADNADPQNNCHAAAWVTNTGSGTTVGIISAATTLPSRRIWRTTVACNDATSYPYTIGNGLVAISRASSGNYTFRNSGANINLPYASTGTLGSNTAIFARTIAATSAWAGTASFYSLGEALDLALLDARLTTLMAALT